MSHTPVPWWVDGPGEGIEVHATFGRTASVWGGGGCGREAWANARLIAAAPELLAALKKLVDEFDEAVDWIPEYMSLADDARMAIAKAEGRE